MSKWDKVADDLEEEASAQAPAFQDIVVDVIDPQDTSVPAELRGSQVVERRHASGQAEAFYCRPDGTTFGEAQANQLIARFRQQAAAVSGVAASGPAGGAAGGGAAAPVPGAAPGGGETGGETLIDTLGRGEDIPPKLHGARLVDRGGVFLYVTPDGEEIPKDIGDDLFEMWESPESTGEIRLPGPTPKAPGPGAEAAGAGAAGARLGAAAPAGAPTPAEAGTVIDTLGTGEDVPPKLRGAHLVDRRGAFFYVTADGEDLPKEIGEDLLEAWEAPEDEAPGEPGKADAAAAPVAPLDTAAAPVAPPDTAAAPVAPPDTAAAPVAPPDDAGAAGPGREAGAGPEAGAGAETDAVAKARAELHPEESAGPSDEASAGPRDEMVIDTLGAGEDVPPKLRGARLVERGGAFLYVTADGEDLPKEIGEDLLEAWETPAHETAGDETAGDETAGDETAGDETAGDETAPAEPEGAGGETGGEAGGEAAMEAGREAAKEAGREAAMEAGREAAMEAGREAAMEAGGEAAAPRGRGPVTETVIDTLGTGEDVPPKLRGARLVERGGKIIYVTPEGEALPKEIGEDLLEEWEDDMETVINQPSPFLSGAGGAAGDVASGAVAGAADGADAAGADDAAAGAKRSAPTSGGGDAAPAAGAGSPGDGESADAEATAVLGGAAAGAAATGSPSGAGADGDLRKPFGLDDFGPVTVPDAAVPDTLEEKVAAEAAARARADARAAPHAASPPAAAPSGEPDAPEREPARGDADEATAVASPRPAPIQATPPAAAAPEQSPAQANAPEAAPGQSPAPGDASEAAPSEASAGEPPPGRLPETTGELRVTQQQREERKAEPMRDDGTLTAQLKQAVTAVRKQVTTGELDLAEATPPPERLQQILEQVVHGPAESEQLARMLQRSQQLARLVEEAWGEDASRERRQLHRDVESGTLLLGAVNPSQLASLDLLGLFTLLRLRRGGAERTLPEVSRRLREGVAEELVRFCKSSALAEDVLQRARSSTALVLDGALWPEGVRALVAEALLARVERAIAQVLDEQRAAGYSFPGLAEPAREAYRSFARDLGGRVADALP